MCRNIIPLRRKEVPVLRSEIEASALQYLRKIAAITSPVSRQRVVPAEALAVALASVTEAASTMLAAAGSRVVDLPEMRDEVRDARARVQSAARRRRESVPGTERPAGHESP